jgi:YD repeat-containing protein
LSLKYYEVQVPASGGQNLLFMAYLDQGHIGTLTDAAGVVWKYYYDADGKRRIKVKTAAGRRTRPVASCRTFSSRPFRVRVIAG